MPLLIGKMADIHCIQDSCCQKARSWNLSIAKSSERVFIDPHFGKRETKIAKQGAMAFFFFLFVLFCFVLLFLFCFVFLFFVAYEGFLLVRAFCP